MDLINRISPLTPEHKGKREGVALVRDVGLTNLMYACTYLSNNTVENSVINIMAAIECIGG